MRIQPLIGALGAELWDIDLSKPLDAEAFDTVKQALLDHQVIVFRDQQLSLDQYKAFAKRFGPLHVFSYLGARPLPGHDDILRVVKEKDDKKIFGEKWHADVTFLEKPILGSMLYAIETPPRGGDTLFANMYAAYDALSEGMKEILDDLQALHETKVYEQGVKFDVANPPPLVQMQSLHPVIARHPETGRKLLNVNRTYTTKFQKMTEEDSKPLLDHLFQHAVKAEFITRLHWAPGTLAFWDNRCTQHLPVNDYHGFRREMYRITVL